MSRIQGIVFLLCFISFSFVLAEQNVTEDKIEKPLDELDADESGKLQSQSPMSFIDRWKQAVTDPNATVVKPEKPGACTCGGGMCGCCSRMLYDFFRQRACVNVTYEPDEFSFTANILMNDRVVYTRTVSGKNPPPICVPVPALPVIRACVRFYNIYFQGRNVHLCMNMEGKFAGTTMLKVGFNCLRMGSNGFAIERPEAGGGLGSLEFLPTDPDEDQSDEDYSAEEDSDEDDDLDF